MDIIEILINVFLTMGVSITLSFILIRYSLKKFNPLISKAFSIMQTIGLKTRMDNKFNKVTAEDVDKAAEGQKLIMGDLLNQFPEIKMVLEHFSPETVEWLEDNPMAALRLIQRYMPFIQQFMGLTKGKKAEEYNV